MFTSHTFVCKHNRTNISRNITSVIFVSLLNKKLKRRFKLIDITLFIWKYKYNKQKVNLYLKRCALTITLNFNCPIRAIVYTNAKHNETNRSNDIIVNNYKIM